MFYVILIKYKILDEEAKLPCSLRNVTFTIYSLVKHRGIIHLNPSLFHIHNDKVNIYWMGILKRQHIDSVSLIKKMSFQLKSYQANKRNNPKVTFILNTIIANIFF